LKEPRRFNRWHVLGGVVLVGCSLIALAQLNANKQAPAVGTHIVTPRAVDDQRAPLVAANPESVAPPNAEESSLSESRDVTDPVPEAPIADETLTPEVIANAAAAIPVATVPRDPSVKRPADPPAGKAAPVAAPAPASKPAAAKPAASVATAPARATSKPAAETSSASIEGAAKSEAVSSTPAVAAPVASAGKNNSSESSNALAEHATINASEFIDVSDFGNETARARKQQPAPAATATPTKEVAVAPEAKAPAKPAGLVSEPAVIDHANVSIGGINSRSAVSRASVRSALNVGAMTACYRSALKDGSAPSLALNAEMSVTTSSNGSVSEASLEAPSLPAALRHCIEQVARRGRVREADTGEAQASITLAFSPR
jgi:hypothetical protein